MEKIAPIVIFTYLRLNLLKKCLKSLKKNTLASESKLFIFSDGPKNKFEFKKVQKVRQFLKSIKGFKAVKVIKRKKNIGLSKNIINGVTNIIKKEKKIIVLEDDMIVSKNFLNFLNKGLYKYYSNKKVWHISAWNYNLNLSINEDTFFTRGMNCWGWATWEDRWKHFRKKPDEIVRTWKNKEIREFNFDDSINFFSQIIRNRDKTLNSWAVFWYATIFKRKGLCLNPKYSLTQNIGSGTSSTNTKTFEKIFNSKLKINYPTKYSFPKITKENLIAFKEIKRKIRINKTFKFLKKIFKK